MFMFIRAQFRFILIHEPHDVTFPSHTYDNELADYQLPEMLRVGIEDLVLQVLVLDLGEPSTFLGKALNPPSDLALSNSLQLLETLGAVECRWAKDPGQLRSQQGTASGSSNQPCGQLQVTSELTALGFHLATLDLDANVAEGLQTTKPLRDAGNIEY